MINQVAILFQTLLATLKIALGIGIGVGIHQAVQPNKATSTIIPPRRPPFGIMPEDFPSTDGIVVTTTAMPDVQISIRPPFGIEPEDFPSTDGNVVTTTAMPDVQISSRPPFGIKPEDFPSTDGNFVTTTAMPDVQQSSPLPPFGREKRETEAKYDIKIRSMENISRSRIQSTQPLVVGGMSRSENSIIDRVQSIIINSIKPDPLFQDTTKEPKCEAI